MDQSSYLRYERSLLALLSAFSTALIVAALYTQLYWHADPCPLCILQRYAYLLIALFALLGAIACNKRALKLNQILILLTAATGIAVATRQLWLLSHPFLSCGFDKLQPIVNNLPLAEIWPTLFKSVGLCESPSPPILGLSLPAWSLIGYLLIFAIISLILWKKTHNHAAR